MSAPDYEKLAKAAGWAKSIVSDRWYRHPKDGEWKRNLDGSYACVRANGALDPEYIFALSAEAACKLDGLT